MNVGLDLQRQTDRELEARSGDLIPCPFCGWSATVKAEHILSSSLFSCFVKCGRCSCELGNIGLSSQETIVGEFDTVEDAIAAWNRRTP